MKAGRLYVEGRGDKTFNPFRLYSLGNGPFRVIVALGHHQNDNHSAGQKKN